MYENNYPNDRTYQNTGYQERNTYGQGGQQDSYSGSNAYQQGSTGSYQYGGAYANSYARVEQKQVKKPKEKKGAGSYFKKAAAADSLGLLFGLFAGLGPGKNDGEAMDLLWNVDLWNSIDYRTWRSVHGE